MKTIDEATNFLSGINNINWGGCLVSAYVFYLNEERAGRHKKLQLVALGRSEGDGYLSANEAYIKGKAKNATSAAHYGWTYNGGKTVYDCYGLQEDYSHKLLIPKDITKQFAVSALNAGGWNTSFDRRKHLPKLEKWFELDLSDVARYYTTENGVWSGFKRKKGN